VAPGVSGTTGMETASIIRGIISEVEPDALICVDSLASKKTARIALSFQAADTGIVPGGGVGNARTSLDRGTLGIPVIAVGVPLVVYAATIAADAAGKQIDELPAAMVDLVVTPKDIDVQVRRCAAVISQAINSL
ncbi:MAG: GPR endopeptidase, partial [Firmicutes bacterium]|nr:GPR endopeptidase [Bacillota bacterium]